MTAHSASDVLSPAGAIRAAKESHPAFKFATVVAGLAAVVDVVLRFGASPQTLILGIIVLFVFMVLFIVFAQVARARKADLAVPAAVLVWASLILVIVVAVALLISALWNVPFPVRDAIVNSIQPTKPIYTYWTRGKSENGEVRQVYLHQFASAEDCRAAMAREPEPRFILGGFACDDPKPKASELENRCKHGEHIPCLIVAQLKQL